MNITVILTGPLSKYGNGSRELILEGSSGWTVGDVIRSLMIPDQSYSFAAMGGQKVNTDKLLAEGDIVTIFPPVSGG